jgi:hypothetical protein
MFAPRLPIVPFAFVAISGWGIALPPPERLVTWGAAERVFVPSDLLFRDAGRLLRGDQGVRELVAQTDRRDPEVSRAALLTLLRSGDPQFLPLVLTHLDSPDSRISPIVAKAVEMYPERAWPLLLAHARAGSVGAIDQIDRYAQGKAELARLTYAKPPRVRAAALARIWNPERSRQLLDDPSPEVVRAAVRSLIFNADLGDTGRRQLLDDRRERVRALAAEHAPRWTQDDFAQWARLARHDPSPRVRRWAMLHLTPLGLEWGKGPWVPEGIEAVRRGIVDGPPAVRATAVIAARGWMLEWDQIDKRWSPADVEAAQRVFRLPQFQQALRAAVKREDPQTSTDFAYDVLMAPARRALEIAGAPRSGR